MMRALRNAIVAAAISCISLIPSGAYAAEPPVIRIGAWNIEWLGRPGNRTGIGEDVSQKPEDIAEYITASGVSILSLEEICDDDGESDKSTNTTLDATIDKLNTDTNVLWKYQLFPKKDPNSLDQHVGVAWNSKAVTLVGDPYRLPIDDSHFDFNLLERGVHAVKFSLGDMKSDVVLVPLHLKSNRGGAVRTAQQRAEEVHRLIQSLDELEAHFDDLDIILLGDTNVLSADERAIRQLVEDDRYVDLNSGDAATTWSGDAPFDRILIKSEQPELLTDGFRVFKPSSHTNAEHKRLLSDHFMVTSKLAVLPDDDDQDIQPGPRGRSAQRGFAQRDRQNTEEAPRAFESVAERYLGTNPDGESFELSQDYPTQYNIGERFPWQEIDFKTRPKAYMNSVLRYCFEGNDTIDFKVQDNAVRKWYHAPWLHDDGVPNGAGREYIHGLTRERRSRPGELHALQKDYAQNWAVGFYNDRGGYTLGNVWKTADGTPNPYASTFPDHTVAFKLLFTDASEEQVPFLQVKDPANQSPNGKGSLKWDANIYKDTKYELPRETRSVRLLQVDVAIKDPRASLTTGWVFGTFIFDGSRNANSVIDNLVYVGLSWHDDENVFSRVCAEPVDNVDLRGSIINPELIDPSNSGGNRAKMLHLGLGGRMNGPVDNAISSCISCHGRAALAVPQEPLSLAAERRTRGTLMPFFNDQAASPTKFTKESLQRFFRSIRGGSHLEEDRSMIYVTTDYSQQLAVGIRNYYQTRLTFSAARNLEPAEVLPLGSRGPD